MNLFEFDKQSFTVHLTEEALLLKPFKAVYDKDKSKNKDLATTEMGVVWFFTDLTSPYQSITDDTERMAEIVKDIDGLPKNWKPDKVVLAAIEFYKKLDTSIIKKLYSSSIKAADTIHKALEDTATLIGESKDQALTLIRVTSTLERVPKVMRSLREVEKELIHEIEDKEGKKKGSKTFNTFEDGLSFE